MTKNFNFYIKMGLADGRHIGMHRFGHNLAADCPIFVNFCTKMQKLTVATVECEKFIFKYKILIVMSPLLR